jgi:DNA repair photolyase
MRLVAVQLEERAVGPEAAPSMPVLEERLRGTKFVPLNPKSVLNSPEQTGMDFWSLNPYVGCEFGCSYCYARYAHRYVVERAHDAGKLSDAELAEFRGPHGWEAFEQRIFVKQQILAALDSDLRRFFRCVQRPRDTIVIGTATDPYQPAERRFRLTRAVLARLAQCEGLSIGLITKSSLVARDADLFTQIQLKRLTDAGVNAGLIVAPVLPGISDDVPRLDALFRAARAAGARFLTASPLRLYPGIRDRFLPVLDQHFPALADRYRRAYAGRGAAPRDYARALSRRIRRLQVKWGFPVWQMSDRYEKRRPAPQRELPL